MVRHCPNRKDSKSGFSSNRQAIKEGAASHQSQAKYCLTLTLLASMLWQSDVAGPYCRA